MVLPAAHRALEQEAGSDRDLEELSGQSCGVHMTGGFMLAADKDRLDYLDHYRDRPRG